jgi:hypothetical protein
MTFVLTLGFFVTTCSVSPQFGVHIIIVHLINYLANHIHGAVFLETVFAQLVKKLQAFYPRQNSLTFSQEPAAGPNCVFNIRYNMILLSMHFQWFSCFQIVMPKHCIFSSVSWSAACPAHPYCFI